MARLAEDNVGFKGTVTTDNWAETMKFAGVQYAVGDHDHLVASAGTGDRVVKVGPGHAWGDGVLSYFRSWTDDVTLRGDPVTSGTVRWDTLVASRTWLPNGVNNDGKKPFGKTELVLVKGTATPTVRYAHNFGEGHADQPLWLVRFDAGKSAAQDFVDLRTFVGNGGGLLAREEMVLQFLTEVGTHVTLAGGAKGEGKTWYRGVDSNGNAVWQQAIVPYHQHSARDILDLTNPIAGDRSGLQVRYGSWAGPSSASGGMTINFAPRFPNACLAVVITNGAGDSISFWPEMTTKNAASFSYRIRNAAGAAIPNVQHRVDYIAIGI